MPRSKGSKFDSMMNADRGAMGSGIKAPQKGSSPNGTYPYDGVKPYYAPHPYYYPPKPLNDEGNQFFFPAINP